MNAGTVLLALVVLAPLAALAQRGRDLELGERVAVSGGGDAVTPCQTCHGDHGQGMDASDFPRLAGQPAPYLRRQLEAYADGRRDDPIMSTIARAMTPAQRDATSAWYAQLAAPAGQAVAKPAATPKRGARAPAGRGQQLATLGDGRRNVQACADCHAPGGTGQAPDVPYLAGQDREYLQASLAAFRTGRRRTDESGQMRFIAQQLSEQDVASVASYFAARPPPSPVEAAGVRDPEVRFGDAAPATHGPATPVTPPGATSRPGGTRGPGGSPPPQPGPSPGPDIPGR
jgi:cytochrome c553